MTRLFIAVLFVITACRGGRVPREDARNIVRAYEAFQNASAFDRPAALASLGTIPCGDPNTCADRDACATHARHLFRAQDLARRARELGPEDAGGNGAATPAELSVIISAADDEAKAATVTEPTCRDALARLYAAARD